MLKQTPSDKTKGFFCNGSAGLRLGECTNDDNCERSLCCLEKGDGHALSYRADKCKRTKGRCILEELEKMYGANESSPLL